MTRNEIFETFVDVFKDVMDLDDVELKDETTAHDVEEWDSLTNIRLIVAVERSFGVRFTNAEIEAMGCVGDLINSIDGKSNG